MAKVLTSELPSAKRLFDEASEILGYDLLHKVLSILIYAVLFLAKFITEIILKCVQGPKEELDSTVISQPAIFVASMAGLEKLKVEDPSAVESATVAMGVSLGL